MGILDNILKHSDSWYQKQLRELMGLRTEIEAEISRNRKKGKVKKVDRWKEELGIVNTQIEELKRDMKKQGYFDDQRN